MGSDTLNSATSNITYNTLNNFGEWEDTIMGNDDIASELYQQPPRDSEATDVGRNGYLDMSQIPR